MKYNHEDAENQLLAEGDADFQVIKATDEVSKSGNEMIALLLKVWDSEGREGTIFDYLLPKLAWKIKHFCEATGISMDKFKSNQLCAADCADKTGKAKIKTQVDKTGQYQPKSVIADYFIKLNAGKEATAQNGNPPPFDDDIPF